MEIAVRYHEIALKGGNRAFFVSQLVRNLRRATSEWSPVTVQSVSSRILLSLPDSIPAADVLERVGSVLGVANFSTVREAPPDLAQLKERIVHDLTGRQFASFRITTKRSFKRFPARSLEIDRALGSAVQQATGARVDLEQPELTIFVEVLKDRILYCTEKHAGPGGLAVGSSGRVLALLSGGIDSPVAAYRLMKRGCRATLVHFHAFPLQDRATIEKTQALAEVLTRYQFRTRLILIPFGAVQQQIVASCPAPLRVILYRRMMLRIAERVAGQVGAKALITGESLGQVASQTLLNIAAIGSATRLPILRPLIGMDKEEITVDARRIGTFPISIQPDQDCCQLFVPRSPSTAAQPEEVESAETALDVPALIQSALDGVERMLFEFPPRLG